MKATGKRFMIQEQRQEQALTQQQKLTQSITQQQLLVSQLTQMPVMQLVERIDAEMNDNPALEVSADGFQEQPELAESSEAGGDTPDGEQTYEQEERQSALDDALASLGRDDEDLPVYHGGGTAGQDQEEYVFGQTVSFADQLTEQMNMAELTERQRDIMEYLIGSLDDDGLLRKSLDSISDELAIYHGIDASEQEIEQVLHVLQDFDPAGIGGRTLQECLLLQVERREPSRLTELMRRTLTEYFEAFTKKHWDVLRRQLRLNELQGEALIAELRKLNPKPGASISETVGHSLQQITPDVIVETHDDGTVSFALNNSEVPELCISQSFSETLQQYQQNRDHMSRQMKEALLYTKQKVDAAQGFIDALRQREHTITVTMAAIIKWQRRFFEDGDEASLRPMKLKDIAEQTGLDLSTVSRVSNSKYAQTRWGTFPLRYFFSQEYTTAGGEELSTREIKAVLRDVIGAEDKQKPLSDEALQREMEKRGYPIARRTVTKYRVQLGIPVARLRK